MRIAHVTHTFPPYRGGTGNVCRGNAAAVAARGHEVHVFTSTARGAPKEERLSGAEVYVHRLRPLLRLGNAPCQPQLARRLVDFDVIHLHYPSIFSAEWVLLALNRTGAPLVLTAHQDVAFSGPLALAYRGYDRLVNTRVLRAARRIVTPSRDAFAASALAPLLAEAPCRVVEVPNGVDHERFHPGQPSRALLDRYGLHSTSTVLFVGGMDRPHKFKGVEILLRAFTLVEAKARLLLVGDGVLRPGYEALARHLGIAERVVFAGAVADDELPEHYRLADVAVLPSTTREEIFGLVLAEALATGVPVIASRLPGVRTVVEEEVDGLLVPPRDAPALAAAIDRLLALSPASRAALGAAGREKVRKRYDWDAIGVALDAIYKEVAG